MLETRMCARMSGRKVLQSVLFASASAVAICGFAGTAGAQDAQTGQTTSPAAATDKASTVKEVVVTGIRASLQNSQNIKRNADTFVDSITAEDIGALPDRSVTEALSRVPGVAIDRFAAGVDPDHFSVEGSNLVVRGLTLTRSEFNSRDSFTANSGQGLNFADVPAELMGGVDVFKNGTADMIEGGISGTINLRTRLPFDQAGQVISFSAQDSYADLDKRAAPTGTFLYTNRWNTAAGEFGFLASYTNNDLKSRADAQQISNFNQRVLTPAGLSGNYILDTTAGDPNYGKYVDSATSAPPVAGSKEVWFPRGAAFREDVYDHRRIGDSLAAQWRSPDHTMLATLQFLRSDTRETWNEHAMEIATDNVANNGNSYPVTGSAVNFGSNNVFENGVISSPSTGWRADLGTENQRTPGQGLQSNDIARSVNQRDVTEDESFNFKWTPNEHWAFNLDVQHVQSHVTDLDVGLWSSEYQNVGINMAGQNGIPVVTFQPPSTTGSVVQCPTSPPPSKYNTSNCSTYYNTPHNNFSDPYNAFPRAAMDHYENSDGVENAVRLDGEYRFANDGWLKSIRGGLRWSEEDRTTRYTTYNWGVISEQWGNNGPIWEDNPVVPAGAFQPFAFSDFLRGEVPVPTGSQPRLFYTGNTTGNYKQFAAQALQMENAWYAQGGATPSGWLPLADRPGVVKGTMFEPYEINPQTETRKAAYIMAKYGHDFEGGAKLSGNFGVRLVQIDRHSEGLFAFPALTSVPDCSKPPPAGQQPSLYCQLPTSVQGQITAFANGATIPNNKNLEMTYVLPSFNAKLEWRPGHVIRFAVDKGITPPDFGLTRDYFNVTPNTGQAQFFVYGNGPTQAPTGTQISATSGNPLLKWTQATNFDLSYEWYFSKVGSLTASLFYKELKDVVTNGTVEATFNNNGATFTGPVTTPINSPVTAKVKGLELDYQQTYSFLPGLLSGLGLNVNWTYVDSSGVPQSTLSATDPNVAAGNVANVPTQNLPLQGLSKYTWNFAPFYEKGPVSLRIAYNWRSRYLLTVRDVIVPYAPIMQENYGTLDASAFYTLDKHWKVGVQAVNLLDSVTRTSSVLAAPSPGDIQSAPRSFFMQDRRVTAILRGTF